MTDDSALLRLLDAAEAARSKVVMVGDHRQLGSVGPGGGFESLVARYGAAVHVLADNVRQRNVAERAALAQLRDGDVAEAVAWYAGNGRIVPARSRDDAIEAVVSGWLTDVVAGHEAAMYAWRRANVADLNRCAREAWRSLGRLGDDELVAPGGTRYAVGDRVVTLAPGATGQVVTSETGTVVGIDKGLWVRMDDDEKIHRLGPDEIGADRLAHGFAVTVHRSQGWTVERAHAFEDGGGRELAYVKMSRAKDSSTVYIVADSVEQAAENLRWDWATERRLTWVTESDIPTPAPTVAVDQPPRPGLARERERLLAERRSIVASIPPDPADALHDAQLEYACLRREREHLASGEGRFAEDPIGHAVRELERAQRSMADLRRRLDYHHPSRRQRWRLESELADWQAHRSQVAQRIAALSAPELDRLDKAEHSVQARRSELEAQRDHRNQWIYDHPELRSRVEAIDAELERIDAAMGVTHEPLPPTGIEPYRLWLRHPPMQERTLGIELGL